MYDFEDPELAHQLVRVFTHINRNVTGHASYASEEASDFYFSLTKLVRDGLPIPKDEVFEFVNTFLSKYTYHIERNRLLSEIFDLNDLVELCDKTLNLLQERAKDMIELAESAINKTKEIH